MKKILLVSFGVLLFLVFSWPKTVSSSAASCSGLVSYWKMDENNGNNVADVISNNNGNASGTTNPDGVIGKGRGFSGNDFISINNNGNSLNLTSSMSFAAWINPSSVAGDGFIWYREKNTAGEYRLRRSGTELYFQINNGPWYTHATTGLGLSTGTWYYVVVTLDATAHLVKIYVNGTEKYSGPQPVNLASGTSGFAIGKENGCSGSCSNFAGLIDEVGVWNRALSPGEIGDLYNSGGGNTCPYVAPSASPSPTPTPTPNPSCQTCYFSLEL